MAAIELSFTAWKPYPAPWHFLHTLAAAHKNSPFLKSNDPLKPETSPSFLPLPRHSCEGRNLKPGINVFASQGFIPHQNQWT